MRKSPFFFLTMLAVFLAVPGTPSQSVARDEGKRVLTIISPHTEGIRVEFARAFKEWHEKRTGRQVEVEWLDLGGTSDDVRYVRSEFRRSPAGIGIDIFWGGGIEPYMEFAKAGYLVPYKLPEEVLEALPREVAGIPLYDSGHRWYGAALSGFGIVYNRSWLKKLKLEPPQTWEDLCKPALVGEVSSADPRHSGSAHACYEIILQAYGWEKGFEVITLMSANVKSFTQAASEVPKMVSLGEVSCGLAIDFYAWAQIAKDGKEKIGFTIPVGVTVINPDAIAILKGAPQRKLAEEFVTFVMSEEGQKLWILPKGAPGGPRAYELNRIPASAGLLRKYAKLSRVTFDPTGFTASFEYDSGKATLRQTALNDLIGAVLIDTHRELRAAWEAVIGRGLPEEEVRRLATPPVGEDELLRLAGKDWKNPVLRNRKISQWTRAAKKKYESITRGG